MLRQALDVMEISDSIEASTRREGRIKRERGVIGGSEGEVEVENNEAGTTLSERILISQDPYDRRELSPTSCPTTSICTLWNMHQHAHSCITYTLHILTLIAHMHPHTMMTVGSWGSNSGCQIW